MMKSRYGLTTADYEALYVAQGGVCGVCQAAGRLYVDHCHTSGHVRGLLCPRCNLRVGVLETTTAETLEACLDWAARGPTP